MTALGAGGKYNKMKKLRKYLNEWSDSPIDFKVEEWLTKFSLIFSQRNCYFVDKGAIRMFVYSKEKEVTVWLTREGSFFTHLDSFNNDKPSDCIIEAMEDTTLYLLGKSNYNHLMDSSPYFSKLILKVWQEAFIKITHAIVAFQGNTADERYDNLQSETDYTLRFKQKFLASFLGVTPSS